MEERYQTLIDDVSVQIASRLFEDREWLEQHHRLQLDALMFQLMMQIGLAALSRLFERFCDKKVEECREDGLCIAESKRVAFSTKLGTLPEVSSPYMRHRQTGQSARPMKEVFGVVGRGKSEALKRALSDFGSEDSYAEAEARFEEHYGFSIGRTSILRVTKKVGQQAQDFVEETLSDGTVNQKGLDELIAQLDGSAVRCGQYMPASQAGLTAEDGYEPDDIVRRDEWKEVRVGLVRDADEEAKKYVCRMGDYETICDQMKALARNMGCRPDTQVISPADGAHGLKEAIEDSFGDVQFILDYFHLKKHFFETAEALGICQQMQQGWVATFMDRIWEGHVDQVLQQLTELHEDTSNQRLDRLIRYLDRFSECVDYQSYEDNGWPIGSGEVESAHKYVPQDRLKLPGACWRKDSINPMMAIRVIKKNGWWDTFWQWRRQTEKAS